MKIPFLDRLQGIAKPSPPAATPFAAQRAAAIAQLDGLRADLPDLLAATVIDIETGQALASHTNSAALAPAKVSHHHAEIIRQKRRAITALHLPDEAIEDIVITLSTQLHLLRISPDSRRLLCLIVGTQDTNLALARETLRQHNT